MTEDDEKEVKRLVAEHDAIEPEFERFHKALSGSNNACAIWYAARIACGVLLSGVPREVFDGLFADAVQLNLDANTQKKDMN